MATRSSRTAPRPGSPGRNGFRLVLAGTLVAALSFVASATGGVTPVVNASHYLPTPQLLADINQLGAGSDPRDFARLGDIALFQADDGVHGKELWSINLETGNVKLVADIYPGPPDSSPNGLVTHEGAVYFAAESPESGVELWKSNGTSSGTTRFADIRIGASSSRPSELTSFAGELYFQASGGSSDAELWRTDDAVGAQLVADINPSGQSHPTYLTVVDFGGSPPALYFSATDGTNGRELFRYDPGSGITQYDLHAGPNSSYPTQFSVVDDVLYVRARPASGTFSLWRIAGDDSTAVDTKILPLTGPVSQLAAASDKLFVSTNAPSDEDLYVILGPDKDPDKILKAVEIGALTSFGDGALFRGDVDDGEEPWYSDGTEGGTHQIADLITGPDPSSPSTFAVDVDKGLAVFTAEQSGQGRQLWVTNGEPGGLRQLTTQAVAGSPTATSVGPGYWLIDLDSGGSIGQELWLSDGDPSGTKLAADINKGTQDSAAGSFVGLGDDVLFYGYSADFGSEWVLYNTQEEAHTVLDFIPGENGLNPRSPASLGDRVVFSGNTDANGREPWVTDGTVAGTAMLLDVAAGAGSSSPRDFVAADGVAFFEADGSLWATHGVVGDPIRVFDGDVSGSVAIGSKLYFEGDTLASGEEPWASDGTLAGTVQLGDLDPGPADSRPSKAVSFGGSVYFVAEERLWTTAGAANDATEVAIPAGVDVDSVAVSLTSLLIATDSPSSGEPVAYTSSDVAQGFVPVDFIGSEPDEVVLGHGDAVGSDNLIASFVEDPRPGHGGYALAVFDGATAVIVTLGDGDPEYEELVAHLDHFYLTVENDFDLGVLFVSDGTQAGPVPIMEAARPGFYELTVIGDVLYMAADVGLGEESYVLDLLPGSGLFRCCRLG